MLVYRVEDYSGIGVYKLGVRTPYTTDLQPGPQRDSILKHKWDYEEHGWSQWHFGFETMDHVHSWFDKECFDDWAEHNSKVSSQRDHIGVSTYDCLPEDVLTGDKQLVFVKPRAQRIHFAPAMVAEMQFA